MFWPRLICAVAVTSVAVFAVGAALSGNDAIGSWILLQSGFAGVALAVAGLIATGHQTSALLLAILLVVANVVAWLVALLMLPASVVALVGAVRTVGSPAPIDVRR